MRVACKVCDKTKGSQNMAEEEYNESTQQTEYLCHVCASLFERATHSDRRAQ